jgi:GT2 family glycosyltransferase
VKQIEPLVYIIILNFNGWQDTLECLHSLKVLNYSNYKIIIVDNASRNDSVTMIRQSFPQHVLIVNEYNLGFAGGNNIGIRQAQAQQAEYIWLLNNDTTVDPNALRVLVEKMEADSSLGMCGSTLVYYHAKTRIQARAGGSYHKWTGATFHLGEHEYARQSADEAAIETRLDYIIGASVLVRKELIAKIGRMEEKYFLYYEDVDWGLRAKQVMELGYAAQSIVYHKEGSSIGTTRSSQSDERRFRSEYYATRSRLLLTQTFFPYALPSVYLSLLLRLLIRAGRGEWTRVRTLSQVLWLLARRGLGAMLP